jgi:hypothetical protein
MRAIDGLPWGLCFVADLIVERRLFSKSVFRKISSRASQIGAALLFDLGTVDRRLVGPDDKANDRHGVFRVNNDRHPTLSARR